MRMLFCASGRAALLAFAVLSAATALSAQTLLTVAPRILEYPSTNVGDRVTRQVFVISQLDSTQTIFVESSNQTFLPDPASIRPVPGELLPYNIIFFPRGAGPVSSTITFYRMVNGQRENLATVEASGEGLSPFEVSPTEIDFGPLPVETRSEFRQIRVKSLQNQTNLEVQVRSIDPDSFEVTPQVAMLSGSGEATVMVRFRPRRTGQSISSINFSISGVTLSVVVRGSGVAFGLEPDELTLPTTPTGCASEAPIRITPYDALDFLIGSQGPPFVVTPTSVVGNQPAEVKVRAAAAAAGVTNGTIVFNARQGGQITQQRLVPVRLAGVEVRAAPEAVDFGSIPPGGPPLERNVVIGSSLAGSAIGVSLAVTSDNPAFEAEANGAAIRVRFSPLAPGPVNGTLTVNVTPLADPSCGRTLRIPLSGTGGNPLLTLTPPSVAFGEVAVGQTARTIVALTNRTAESFEGEVRVDTTAFRVERADNLPNRQRVSVGPGQTVNFEAQFTPTRTGGFVGEASFLLQAIGGSQENAVLTMPLSGEGATRTFSYELIQGQGEPAPLAAGQRIEAPATRAGGSSLLTLRVRNTSEEAAVIGSIEITGRGFELSGVFSEVNVPAGGTFDAPFRFAPMGAGRAEATLAIGGARFPLSGLGQVRGARITGLPATIRPTEQLALGVTLEGVEPDGVDGELEVVFEPADNELVRFETGGRRTAFHVRQGTGVPVFAGNVGQVGLQAGAAAGVLRIRARFTADGEDVTPPGGVEAETQIASGRPEILSAFVEDRTATGFTLVTVGYSPTREATGAVIELENAGGGVSTVTVAGAREAFAEYFAGSGRLGGLFELRARVTTSNAAAARVRVANAAGESDAARVVVGE